MSQLPERRHARMVWMGPLVSFYLLLLFLVAGLVVPELPGVSIAAGAGARGLMLMQMIICMLLLPSQRTLKVRKSTLAIYALLVLSGILRLLSATQSAMPGAAMMNEARYLFLVAWTAAAQYLWRLIPSPRRVGLLEVVALFSAAAMARIYAALGTAFDAHSKYLLYESGIGVNSIGYTLALLLVLLLSELRERGASRLRDWLLVLALLVMVALTGVRSAYVMIAAGLLILVAVSWRPRKRQARLARVALVFGGVLAVASLVAWSSLQSDGSALDSARAGNLDRFSTGRLSLWSEALEGIQHRPLLGHGGYSGDVVAGSSVLGISDEMLRSDGSGDAMLSGGLHNAYLNALYEYGIVGLALLLIVIGLIVRRSLLIYRTGNAVLLAAWVGIAVRQLAEIQGLVGRSNGTGDYLTFLLLAVTAGYSVARNEQIELIDVQVDWETTETIASPAGRY